MAVNGRDRLERQLVAAVTNPRPHVPEAGRLLWQWFGELHEARGYGMVGPDPISHVEIEAWARLRRVQLQPHHVEIVRAMDAAWIEAAHKRNDQGAPAVARTTDQQINPAAFDAVFG
ncbi:phage tail assembly chaperone [Consotaella aegiceratis]|uniref:phage tail assembly chaperone n=1 Tax=Consotaella aegiceratis TaxID=3097961 RepID=UPI002F420005